MSNGIAIGDRATRMCWGKDMPGVYVIVPGYEEQGNAGRQFEIAAKAAQVKANENTTPDRVYDKSERIAAFDAYDCDQNGELKGDELKAYLYSHDLRVIYDPRCGWQEEVADTSQLVLKREDYVTQQCAMVDKTWEAKKPVMLADPYDPTQLARWVLKNNNCPDGG